MVHGRVKNMVQGRVKNMVQGRVKNMVQGRVKNKVQGRAKNMVQGRVKNKVKGRVKKRSRAGSTIFFLVYKCCCKHLLAISKVLEALEHPFKVMVLFVRAISLISIQNWKRRTQRWLTGKVNFAEP